MQNFGQYSQNSPVSRRKALGRASPKPTLSIPDLALADFRIHQTLPASQLWHRHQTAHPQLSSSQGSASAKHRPTARYFTNSKAPKERVSLLPLQQVQPVRDFENSLVSRRKAVGRASPKPTLSIPDLALADFRIHQTLPASQLWHRHQTAHPQLSSTQGSASAKHRPTASAPT